jgi:hypothetical protein
MKWKLFIRQRHLMSPCCIWRPPVAFLQVTHLRATSTFSNWRTSPLRWISTTPPPPPDNNSDSSFAVISFYKFLPIPSPGELKEQFTQIMCELNGRGRIYLNKIGINAQLCIPQASWVPFLAFLHAHLSPDVDLKTQRSCEQVFNRLRVRHGKLLEGLGEDFDASQAGKHLGVWTVIPTFYFYSSHQSND